MAATPHKSEAFILATEAEAWLKLEAMLAASADPKFEGLLRTLRYKLWRTGHRTQPE